MEIFSYFSHSITETLLLMEKKIYMNISGLMINWYSFRINKAAKRE